jgi:hypothetical protein
MRKLLLRFLFAVFYVSRFNKRKLSYLVVIILLILMVLMGCQKSNAEIQSYCDIPVYPNAELVENNPDKAVFLVESLSLSTFKEFYKNNLPVYGWKNIKDRSLFVNAIKKRPDIAEVSCPSFDDFYDQIYMSVSPSVIFDNFLIDTA